ADAFALARYQPGAAPTIGVTVTGPNGGETFFTGSSHRIDWSATGAVSRFDVESSSDGGATYAAVPGCAALAGSIHSCTWASPGPATSNGRVRVTAREAAGGPGSGGAEAGFTLPGGAPLVPPPPSDTRVTTGE